MIQISGECFPRLHLNDLGLFRVHCHGQRGPIQAKCFSKLNSLVSMIIIIIFCFVFKDLSAGDRADFGQTISFQLHDTYEQLIQFPLPILLNSLNILLAARLRLTQDRIRNVTLGKENGLLIHF